MFFFFFFSDLFSANYHHNRKTHRATVARINNAATYPQCTRATIARFSRITSQPQNQTGADSRVHIAATGTTLVSIRNCCSIIMLIVLIIYVCFMVHRSNCLPDSSKNRKRKNKNEKFEKTITFLVCSSQFTVRR